MIKKHFNQSLAFVAGDVQQPKSLSNNDMSTNPSMCQMNTCYESCNY